MKKVIRSFSILPIYHRSAPDDPKSRLPGRTSSLYRLPCAGPRAGRAPPGVQKKLGPWPMPQPCDPTCRWCSNASPTVSLLSTRSGISRTSTLSARRLLHAPQDCVGRHLARRLPQGARPSLRTRVPSRDARSKAGAVRGVLGHRGTCGSKSKPIRRSTGSRSIFATSPLRIEAQREVERTTRRQQALIDFGRAALAGATYDETLADAIDLLRETLDANVVDLYHYDRLTKTFSSYAASDGRTALRSIARVRHSNTSSTARADGRAVRVLGRPHRSARAHRWRSWSECGVLSCVASLIGTINAPVGCHRRV